MLDALGNLRSADFLFYVSKYVGAQAAFILFQLLKLRDHWWWRLELLRSRQIG